MATLGLSRSGGLDLFSQSMTGAPVIRFGLAAMLSLALSTPGRGADTETVEPTQFLMMSDLHFDPMANPKLVDRLSSAEPEEWSDIFESSDNKTPARYGADSNWALLHSALWQTTQTLPSPAFVVLPGDFLAHNFRRQFDTAAADHSDAACLSSPVYWSANLGEAARQGALAYRCAAGHVLLPDYGRCYCSGGG
jgi:hypothetical protein